MKLFALLIFCTLCFAGYAQVTVSGQLTDENGRPVTKASIVINNIGTDKIIAYDISDDEGMYGVTFTTNGKEVDIQVRSMGFGTIIKTIPVQTQNQNFKLRIEAVELKEVVVRASPIMRKGDTINYLVNAFADKQDRTIADVLKRMPDIEVLSDGKVLYQGKPIHKYYIEDMDLLEGKYNLANENIPHDEVSNVQILENHQPIKILDSLQFSDNVALNIKLKNTYAFTGQAEVGSGFRPLLWDANITPLLFTKKQQMLVSYQANNIGDNVALQLKTLTIEDLLEQFENKPEIEDWLSIQQLKPPSFSNKRWLQNNIHLATGNYLHKLQKDYEFRINASYLNDYQQQSGFTNTLFFTPTDTISLFESKYNQLRFSSLETNLTLQKNTNRNYLKNSLQFQGFWDEQRGNIQTNNEPIAQDLSNQYFKLSNKFKTIFPLGKQLITLNSYVELSQTPQTLQINPGQFQTLLNNGNAYEQVSQEVDLQSVYMNNSVGFTTSWKQFSFSPKLGFQLQNQNLESQIITSETMSLSNEFANNLEWARSKLYFNVQTQYKKDKWRIDLTAPINFHAYQIEDNLLQEKEAFEQLTFEPRLFAIYDISNFWKFSTSGTINNQFGTINQLHYAYILKNYRNVQRINTPLPQIFNQAFSGGISYRNPIKSLFWSVVYTQTRSENNLLYQTHILESGAAELQAIEKDNDRKSYNISTRLSRYFNRFNTNTKLNANFGKQNFQQIINDEIINIENQNLGITGKIEINCTDWFSTESQANWLLSKNRIQTQANSIITRKSYLLNLNFYPKENQYLTIKTEYVNNNLYSEHTETFFADILYRYTWKKKNMDFELQWNNIFNTANYRTVNIDTYRYIETKYQIRPSQLLIKVTFSL